MYRPGDVDYCKHGEYSCDECNGIPPEPYCEACEQHKPCSCDDMAADDEGDDDGND